MPIRFVTNQELKEEIEEHYKTADQIVIVGIACTAVLNNLCSSFFEDIEKPRIPVFEQLRNRPLKISAFMVDPYCEYARVRHGEEKPRNDDCRIDLVKNIELLNRLADETRKNSVSIKGEVKFGLLTNNPYVSYTLIRQDNKDNVLYLGFLLREQEGVDCPKVCIESDSERINAFIAHQAALESRKLFTWTPSRNQYHKIDGDEYDVFLCYNHKDFEEVERIANTLRSKYGLLPWFDKTATINRKWKPAILQHLRKTKCAIVFAGQHGFGCFQSLEIGAIRNRYLDGDLTPIPMMLSGVTESPFSDFLVQLNALRSDANGDAVSLLADSIRKANSL